MILKPLFLTGVHTIIFSKLSINLMFDQCSRSTNIPFYQLTSRPFSLPKNLPVNRFPVNRFPVNRFPVNRFPVHHFYRWTTLSVDQFTRRPFYRSTNSSVDNLQVDHFTVRPIYSWPIFRQPDYRIPT